MVILVGIRQRLDHLTYLGVDAVVLSAFYDSPFEHLGRDVRDFSTIGSKYGSFEDFQLLAAELHRIGNSQSYFSSEINFSFSFYIILR